MKVSRTAYFANVVLLLRRLGLNEYAEEMNVTAWNASASILRCFVKSPVVVSLTSYPRRIGTTAVTVRSILNQDVRPDELILWLSPDQFPGGIKSLPDDLQTLQKQGLDIRWCEDNRSYKKLIPALKEYPDAVLVTADDDVDYHSTWLLELLVGHLLRPKDVIAHRGHRVCRGADGGLLPYRQWLKEVPGSLPSFENFATGCGGILYPPGSLHPDVGDSTLFNEICPHGDDIWFWGMTLRNGTRVSLLYETDFRLCTVPGTEESSLWIQNVRQGGNDRMIQALLQRFPEILSRLPPCAHAEAKVSIIVPVYNTASIHIQQCLRSLLSQSYQNIEILCIDDGSGLWETLGCLQRFLLADKRVQVFRINNGGPASARNFGISFATGEYIAFVDSDDYVSPHYIRDLVAAIRQDGHPDRQVAVAGRILCFDDKSQSQSKPSGYEGLKRLPPMEVAREAIHTTGVSCNKLYRSSFLRENGIRYLNGERSFAEDNYFSALVAIYARGRMGIADESCYCYRQHSESITKRIDWAGIQSAALVYEKLKAELVARGLPDLNYWHSAINRRALKDLRYNAKGIDSSGDAMANVFRRFSSRIDVCCIADDKYFLPTAVFLETIRASLGPYTTVSITVLVPQGSFAKMSSLSGQSSEKFSVRVAEVAVDRFEGLHKYDSENSFCMASPSALIKFVIPEIFPELDRILYLDTDLMVRKDLLDLYMAPIEDVYLAAVTDMWMPVTDRVEVKRFGSYFNSGVMLMNLAAMRRDEVPEKLIAAKARSTNFNLMDQDVFNEVCHGKVLGLDISYNFLPVCYKRHKHRFRIDVMNTLYGSSYPTVEAMANDPAIAHWAGSDKPWKTAETLFAEEWREAYRRLEEAGVFVQDEQTVV
ncbi:glycosyltransferase [Piscinibacter sakaiensis]